MPNAFIQDQKGGVSPQFAIMLCTVFLIMGGALYFQSETVYGLFDDLMNEIKYVANL